MWGFIQLGIWGALLLGNWLLKKREKAPRPSASTDIALPRIEEGSPVPAVFGRVRVTSPVLVWSGPLKSKTPSSGTVVYGMDMLFALGTPMQHGGTGLLEASSSNPKIPHLYNVWYGDKKLTPPRNGYIPHSEGAVTRRAQAVTRMSLLGGQTRGGGISGAYEFFWGSKNLNLTFPPTKIGDVMTAAANGDNSMIPGYRNLLLVAFTDLFGSLAPYANRMGVDGADNPGARPQCFTIGESPSIEGFSFEVSSFGDVGSDVSAMVDWGYDFRGDADPIAVIYDVLTNSWSKIGLDASKVDKTSFLAASTTLKAEGHGYSRVHYDNENGVQIISEVLQQIDATLYEEPSTGKIAIKLIRADYDVSTLPIFDESNIIEVETYDIGSAKEAINEVRVSYTDRASEYKTQVAVAQSLANATTSDNRRRSRTIDYPGISNATIASKVAARDLNALARPFKRITFVANRDGYEQRPGSVIKVAYAEYGINATVFRVGRVDLGQLFDNKVVIEAIEDVFASTYVGYVEPLVAIRPSLPFPLVEQFAVECPRQLAKFARMAGLINSEDTPRLLPLAVPSTNAVRLLTSSRKQPSEELEWLLGVLNTSSTSVQGIFDPLYGEYAIDVPPINFPISFTVKTAYAREKEPYDTVTGLEIEHVIDPNQDEADLIAYMEALSASETSIRRSGQPLIAVIDADGRWEFMCFESVTNIGTPGVSNGPYRLNNVWRGVMDTAPIAHDVGDRGFFVSSFFVGRRGYLVDDAVNYQMLPFGQDYSHGSGGDPYDTIRVTGRAWSPLPASDMTVGGELVIGTQGVPAVAGRFKFVSQIDGAFDVYGNYRDRLTFGIVRGDVGPQTNQEFTGTGFVLKAAKLDLNGKVPSGIEPSELLVDVVSGLTLPSGQAAEDVLLNGHGSHAIILTSQRELLPGQAGIGTDGLEPFDILENANPPSIIVAFGQWRNILGNGTLNYGNGGVGTICERWTQVRFDRLSGSSSVSRAASGNDSWYARPSATATSGNPATITNVSPVDAWLPRGMTAIAWGYIRNLSSDANDQLQIDLDGLDSGAASVANANSGVLVPPTNNWSRTEVALTGLPATTNDLRFKVTSTEVATGGSSAADSSIAEMGMCLGQIYNGTLSLLTNASFDSGTGSWTATAGSLATATTIASPSVQYVTGGANATNTAHQEFTLPAGYECGATAVLRFFRAQVLSGDAGTVKIEAMDAGSNVLASATTGSEQMAALNQWYRRVLACNIPDGSTKVRVIVTLLRSAGAGNSGAAVDELHLSLHKKLDPSFERVLDFGSPRKQPVPTTWQEYDLEFEGPTPIHVFSGKDFNHGWTSHSETKPLEWSDNGLHAQGKMVGFWNGLIPIDADIDDLILGQAELPKRSVDSYQFTRQSGGLAACVEAVDRAIDTLAAYGSADPLTVVVFFRVDELPWTSTACGLVGRRDLTAGWGLSISSGGIVTATLEGTGGTKTATAGTSVVDGAIHMAAFTYNPATHELIAYDELGPGTTTSTATGLGEFARTAAACRFRIGRSSSSDDTLPGQIANVFIFEQVLTEDDIADLWTYGENPTDVAMTYTRDKLAWTQIGSDDDGELIAPWATHQWALTAEANSPGASLALAKACTNRVPSWDFGGASWVVEAGVGEFTAGVQDASGLLKGITVSAVPTTSGLKLIGMSFSATATATLVFWARAGGSVGVTIDMMNASDVIKNSQAVTLSATWARYVVSFTGWDASTGTARLRFRATSGLQEFTISHVVFCDQGTEIPLLYPGPGVTMADVTVADNETLPRQLNSEGEIVLEGYTLKATPPATMSLLTVRNNSDNKNRREITANSSAQAILNHYDATTPTNVTSTATAIDWKQGWTIRGRWCRASTLDNAANPFAGIVVDGSVDSAVYGRSATFSESSAQSTLIEINKGASAGGHLALSKVVVLTREEKLP